MKNNFNIKITLLISALAVWTGCSKKYTDYKSFLNGQESVYPAAVTNVSIYPGNYRLKLQWNASSDPSITRYIVYWNNYSDSLIVSAKSHNPTDTIRCLINNLQEYTYTFFINTYDSAGNKSITKEVDNARVYGAIYQNSLHNRPINAANYQGYNFPNANTLRLYFLQPDTVNISTHIKYTDNGGNIVDAYLPPDSSSITLANFQLGSSLSYQSSYVPVTGAIDTFTAVTPDTISNLTPRTLQCDKSSFVALNLPNDIQPLFPSTGVAVLWNGSTTPQSWPNVGRFNGSSNMPQHFSFDMGKIYNNLIQLQEIGRGDDAGQNPLDFEVWGIADTANAITQLPGNDPGWKNEALAKGWTLLTEVQRSDDGVAPLTVNLISNPPPVRYIMVRIIQVNDNSANANMTQLTFWDRE
ncbi:MAG TPA: DUF4998 domain-containing protein [Puia sp.]|nr:DUF4998 domain-containing protein [Puia sp.]